MLQELVSRSEHHRPKSQRLLHKNICSFYYNSQMIAEIILSATSRPFKMVLLVMHCEEEKLLFNTTVYIGVSL